MKKLLCVLLCSIIVMTIGGIKAFAEDKYTLIDTENTADISSIQSMSWGIVRVTATSGVNCRSGPGLNYKVLRAYPYDTYLYIIGFSESADGYIWYPIMDRDGNTGWVAGEYVEIIA